VGLLGKTFFSAQDLFTQENVKAEAGEKNTNLYEDASIAGKNRVTN
jgi:hypothetical protein